MVISYNWLKSIINFDLTIDEVSELLTDTGLEVEKIHKIETIKGGLHGLVVGEVLECGPAENSDKLKSTLVDIGDRRVPIVCGAPNVEKGQKVVVAPVGTEVHPTSGASFQIKKAKIRGNVSEGMICAEDEIGLGNDHGGIMILDPGIAAGTSVRSLFKVEDDYQIEIGLTPNRGDAASHLGTARDIKAMGKGTIITPKLASLTNSLNDCLPIEIRDSNACPRYTAILLENITVEESPKWLQDRLRSINLKPINNVVDTTNFVLHELGQPIHAFDADQIDQGIVVRMSNVKDTIVTLDEVERKLTGNELLICDHSKPLAIAGVFGGLHSGVSEKTTRVLIESAYFDPATVRKSAKTQGLSTDASFRYERGCDPNITITALKRVVSILQEVAGAQVASTLSDSYPNAIENETIAFDLAWLNQFCGASFTPEVVTQILTGLDIEVLDQTDTKFIVSVPPYRSDVTRPVDIAEEILRIYGYNNIKIPSRLSMTPATANDFDRLEVKNKVTNFLVNKGFYETMSNSQTAPKTVDQESGVMLLNPLGIEQSMMRTDMYDGLLSSVAHNLNRKQSNVLFFEFGKTYMTKNGQYIEQNNLSLATAGSTAKQNWATNAPDADYFFLKGLLTQLAYTLGVPHKKMLKATKLEVLSADRLKSFGIKKSVGFATLNWDQVLNLVQSNKFDLKDIPKYPIVSRDLSIIIQEGTSFSEIEKMVIDVAGKYYRSIELFDVYEGKNLDKGTKSYAINIELYDSTQTMTDKRIDGIMDKMIQRLEADLNCVIRR